MASDFRGFAETVGVCVGMLAEAFNRKVSAPMIDAYRVGLAGLTPEQVKQATATALRSSKFMPAPAELRELSGQLRAEDRAERAWIAFDGALAQHGPYKSITFDDHTINAVVRSLGGVSVIIEMDSEQYQFCRARFLKAYVALYRSGVNGEAAAPLLGHYDAHNLRSGHQSQQVETINTGLPMVAGHNDGRANALSIVEVPRLKSAR